MKSYVIRVANSAAVSNPREAAYCTRLALTKPGRHGVPDVVLLSEVSPVNVSQVALLHAVGMEVAQYGPSGSAEAGVAVASRLPIRKRSMALGSARTSEGGGIRMRPLVGVKVKGLPWLRAGHAPPPRSPVARAVYLSRARTLRGFVGADWNQPPTWMKRTSVRAYRGIGVLGLLVPLRWKAEDPSPVDIGSDHPAVDVKVTVRSGRRH